MSTTTTIDIPAVTKDVEQYYRDKGAMDKVASARATVEKYALNGPDGIKKMWNGLEKKYGGREQQPPQPSSTSTTTPAVVVPNPTEASTVPVVVAANSLATTTAAPASVDIDAETKKVEQYYRDNNAADKVGSARATVEKYAAKGDDGMKKMWAGLTKKYATLKSSPTPKEPEHANQQPNNATTPVSGDIQPAPTQSSLASPLNPSEAKKSGSKDAKRRDDDASPQPLPSSPAPTTTATNPTAPGGGAIDIDAETKKVEQYYRDNNAADKVGSARATVEKYADRGDAGMKKMWDGLTKKYGSVHPSSEIKSSGKSSKNNKTDSPFPSSTSAAAAPKELINDRKAPRPPTSNTTEIPPSEMGSAFSNRLFFDAGIITSDEDNTATHQGDGGNKKEGGGVRATTDAVRFNPLPYTAVIGYQGSQQRTSAPRVPDKWWLADPTTSPSTSQQKLQEPVSLDRSMEPRKVVTDNDDSDYDATTIGTNNGKREGSVYDPSPSRGNRDAVVGEEPGRLKVSPIPRGSYVVLQPGTVSRNPSTTGNNNLYAPSSSPPSAVGVHDSPKPRGGSQYTVASSPQNQYYGGAPPPSTTTTTQAPTSVAAPDSTAAAVQRVPSRLITTPPVPTTQQLPSPTAPANGRDRAMSNHQQQQQSPAPILASNPVHFVSSQQQPAAAATRTVSNIPPNHTTPTATHQHQSPEPTSVAAAVRTVSSSVHGRTASSSIGAYLVPDQPPPDQGPHQSQQPHQQPQAPPEDLVVIEYDDYDKPKYHGITGEESGLLTEQHIHKVVLPRHTPAASVEEMLARGEVTGEEYSRRQIVMENILSDPSSVAAGNTIIQGGTAVPDRVPLRAARVPRVKTVSVTVPMVFKLRGPSMDELQDAPDNVRYEFLQSLITDISDSVLLDPAQIEVMSVAPGILLEIRFLLTDEEARRNVAEGFVQKAISGVVTLPRTNQFYLSQICLDLDSIAERRRVAEVAGREPSPPCVAETAACFGEFRVVGEEAPRLVLGGSPDDLQAADNDDDDTRSVASTVNGSHVVLPLRRTRQAAIAIGGVSGIRGDATRYVMELARESGLSDLTPGNLPRIDGYSSYQLMNSGNNDGDNGREYFGGRNNSEVTPSGKPKSNTQNPKKQKNKKNKNSRRRGDNNNNNDADGMMDSNMDEMGDKRDFSVEELRKNARAAAYDAKHPMHNTSAGGRRRSSVGGFDNNARRGSVYAGHDAEAELERREKHAQLREQYAAEVVHVPAAYDSNDDDRAQRYYGVKKPTNEFIKQYEKVDEKRDKGAIDPITARLEQQILATSHHKHRLAVNEGPDVPRTTLSKHQKLQLEHELARRRNLVTPESASPGLFNTSNHNTSGYIPSSEQADNISAAHRPLKGAFKEAAMSSPYRPPPHHDTSRGEEHLQQYPTGSNNNNNNNIEEKPFQYDDAAQRDVVAGAAKPRGPKEHVYSVTGWVTTTNGEQYYEGNEGRFERDYDAYRDAAMDGRGRHAVRPVTQDGLPPEYQNGDDKFAAVDERVGGVYLKERRPKRDGGTAAWTSNDRSPSQVQFTESNLRRMHPEEATLRMDAYREPKDAAHQKYMDDARRQQEKRMLDAEESYQQQQLQLREQQEEQHPHHHVQYHQEQDQLPYNPTSATSRQQQQYDAQYGGINARQVESEAPTPQAIALAHSSRQTPQTSNSPGGRSAQWDQMPPPQNSPSHHQQQYQQQRLQQQQQSPQQPRGSPSHNDVYSPTYSPTSFGAAAGGVDASRTSSRGQYTVGGSMGVGQRPISRTPSDAQKMTSPQQQQQRGGQYSNDQSNNTRHR